MLDWGDARFFLTAFREGSLSAAGRRLGVEQSTVGRRLATMERKLGTRLFDRTTEGLVPTAAAEVLAAHCERVEEELFAAERALGGREASLTGTIRLTAPETVGTMLLVPLLAGFRERYPAIALEVLIDNRVLNLSRREADLALRLMRPTQPQLLARRLARVGMGLYASRAYLARRGRPDTPGLEGHDVLGYDEASQPAAESEWLATRAARATVVLRTNSARALLSAATAGLGLALLPCFVADGVAGLVQVRPPRDVVIRELWLLVHHELRHAARVRALTDFLVTEVAARAGALAGSAGCDRSAVAGSAGYER